MQSNQLLLILDRLALLGRLRRKRLTKNTGSVSVSQAATLPAENTKLNELTRLSEDTLLGRDSQEEIQHEK